MSPLGIQSIVSFGVVFAALTLAFAGVVKGITGFGPALVAVPVLVQVFPPKIALTAFSIPLLLSNLYMVLQNGLPREFVFEYKWFILIILGSTVVGVVGLASLPTNALYLSISVYILGYLLIDRLSSDSASPRRRGVRPAIGVATGILGGSVNMGGLPLATYLSSLDLDKQVFATGLVLVLFLHNCVRLLALSASDLFHLREIILGTGFFVPVALGVYGGIQLREHVSEALFERLVKGLLVVSALKLVLEVV
jgi:uncharacterized membrane protein YfcA